jgi:hypothetical protein
VTSARDELTRLEAVIAVVLIGAGLIISASVRPYDSSTKAMAIALTAVSLVAGFGLLWAGLTTVGVVTGRRTAGALWATVAWNTLLLSQIAYVGFLLLPVEIAIAAFILHRRARVGRVWASLSVSTIARIATLLVVYAVAPAARRLFPWP